MAAQQDIGGKGIKEVMAWGKIVEKLKG